VVAPWNGGYAVRREFGWALLGGIRLLLHLLRILQQRTRKLVVVDMVRIPDLSTKVPIEPIQLIH
jgi:hypothetical protein